jgi:hypothetical protein
MAPPERPLVEHSSTNFDSHYRIGHPFDEGEGKTGASLQKICKERERGSAATFLPSDLAAPNNGHRPPHLASGCHEWQYYLEGDARMIVFDATSKTRTFTYMAGDFPVIDARGIRR